MAQEQNNCLEDLSDKAGTSRAAEAARAAKAYSGKNFVHQTSSSIIRSQPTGPHF